MAQHAHHLDDADSLDPPAQMSARDRLHWEVAQLADGTLAPQRRSAVEAALLSDAELRGSYETHRRLDALLRQRPSVDAADQTHRIMQAVMREPAFGAAATGRSTRDVRPAEPPVAVLELVRRWWVSIGAVAAALILGLWIGTTAFGPGGGGSGLSVNVPGGEFVATLEVTGPAAVLRQQQSDPQVGSQGPALAMTVSGPEFHGFTDPQVNPSVPESAAYYGASAIVETSSEMIIGAVAGQ